MVTEYKINESYEGGLNLYIYQQDSCTREEAMYFLLSDNFELNKKFVMHDNIHSYKKIGLKLDTGECVNLIWRNRSATGVPSFAEKGIHFVNVYDYNPDIRMGLEKYAVSSDEHIYIINSTYGEGGCIYPDIMEIYSRRNLRGYHFTDKVHYKDTPGFVYDFGLTARRFFASSVLHKLPKHVFNAKDKSKRFIFSMRKISFQWRQAFYKVLINHKSLYNDKFLVTMANMVDDNKNYLHPRFHSIDETYGGFSFPNNQVKEACWIKKLRDVEFMGRIDVVFESNNIPPNETKIPDGNFLTEKTFNYLFNELPFLYVSNHCHLILKNVGLNDYSEIWGVDFNHPNFNQHVLDRIDELCNLSDEDFEKLIEKAEIVAKQNYDRFLELVIEDPLIKFINLYNGKTFSN